MDAPEVHAPHAAHTGHRWFDFALGGAALLVSAVSLYVAVHHGQTMEKLVQANSFPNVRIVTGLTTTPSNDATAFTISADNTGVGPARIETLEFWVNGRPMRSLDALGAAIRANGGGAPLRAQIGGQNVVGALIGARDKATLVGLKIASSAQWTKPLLKTAETLQSRVCYCSVFDECYVADSRSKSLKPEHADVCPVPAAPYDDDLGRSLTNLRSITAE